MPITLRSDQAFLARSSPSLDDHTVLIVGSFVPAASFTGTIGSTLQFAVGNFQGVFTATPDRTGTIGATTAGVSTFSLVTGLCQLVGNFDPSDANGFVITSFDMAASFVGGTSLAYPTYDASAMNYTPNAIHSAVTIGPGYRFGQFGPITPSHAGTIGLGDYGFYQAVFNILPGAPTYSVFSIGPGVTNTGGVLSVPVPSGVLTGKLILCFAASSTFNEGGGSTPSGYTLVGTGGTQSTRLFGKIGTASESAQNVSFFSGNTGAFMVAISASGGFPANWASLLTYTADFDPTSTVVGQRYTAHSGAGANAGYIQFAVKSPDAAGASGVGVTSGYSAAGAAFSSTLALSAQLNDSVGSGAGQNDVAITGNTSATGSRRITLAFVGNEGATKIPMTMPMRLSRPDGVGGEDGNGNWFYNLVTNP